MAGIYAQLRISFNIKNGERVYEDEDGYNEDEAEDGFRIINTNPTKISGDLFDLFALIIKQNISIHKDNATVSNDIQPKDMEEAYEKVRAKAYEIMFKYEYDYHQVLSDRQIDPASLANAIF